MLQIDSFLVNTWYFLLLLGFFLAAFHYLFIRKFPLCNKTWKRLDYLWLGVAAIGLISLASNIRIDIASNWVDFERQRATSYFSITGFLQENPVDTYYCMEIATSDNSPPNIDEIIQDFDAACTWREEVHVLLSNLKPEELPEIPLASLPKMGTQQLTFTDIENWLTKMTAEYNAQRQIYYDTVALSKRSGFENFLEFLAPYLLSFALAIRITKVTYEVNN